MSANVRCAGGGRWFDSGDGPHKVRPRDLGVDIPCGWKGERYPSGKLTAEEDRLPDWSLRKFDAFARADDRARIAKPCPHCGGRVEMIPQEVEP